MLPRDNFDSVRPPVSRLVNGLQESRDVEGTFAAQATMVARVVPQCSNNVSVSIIELDRLDTLLRNLRNFGVINPSARYVPNVYIETPVWLRIRADEFQCRGNSSDVAERHDFERNRGIVFRRFS